MPETWPSACTRLGRTPRLSSLWSGQVKRDFLGREAFQEVDLVESFGRLTKWAAQIDDPATAAETVRDWPRTALTGRPGPILFSLPEEVLDLPVPRGAMSLSRGHSRRSSRQPPDADAVSEILEAPDTGKRPAMVAG